MSFFRDIFLGLTGVAVTDTLNKAFEKELPVSESQSETNRSNSYDMRDDFGIGSMVNREKEEKIEHRLKVENTIREINAVTKLVNEKHKN